MNGPKERGMKGAEVLAPPLGSYESLDLSKLPKYISYKASLLKQKVLLEYFLITVVLILGSAFINERQINADLTSQLRLKEYIVLPDFIAVSPQSVSDKVIHRAISDFISNLGNINSLDVDENFQVVRDMMSPELRKQFDLESEDIIDRIKSDNVTEILTCPNKKMASNDGIYSVTAFCKKETYVNNEFLGAQEEVVQMKLRLIPPNEKKRWVLEVTELLRTTKKAFQIKKGQ